MSIDIFKLVVKCLCVIFVSIIKFELHSSENGYIIVLIDKASHSYLGIAVNDDNKNYDAIVVGQAEQYTELNANKPSNSEGESLSHSNVLINFDSIGGSYLHTTIGCSLAIIENNEIAPDIKKIPPFVIAKGGKYLVLFKGDIGPYLSEVRFGRLESLYFTLASQIIKP